MFYFEKYIIIWALNLRNRPFSYLSFWKIFLKDLNLSDIEKLHFSSGKLLSSRQALLLYHISNCLQCQKWPVLNFKVAVIVTLYIWGDFETHF